jgi:hypothetical protein
VDSKKFLGTSVKKCKIMRISENSLKSMIKASLNRAFQENKLKSPGLNSGENTTSQMDSIGDIKEGDKVEAKEATTTSSSGQYSGALFGPSQNEQPDETKPMGGDVTESEIEGGKSDGMSIMDLAKKHKVSLDKIKSQLQRGIEVEMEHTNSKSIAKEIAMDHIFEDPNYYVKLKKIEATEATTAGASVGQYDVPFPTKKRKDPLAIDGPKSIYNSRAVKDKSFPKLGGPGSKYVKVKDKCNKFPYCNQGDINSLEIFENKTIKTVVENLSKRTSIPDYVIKNIIANELGFIK